MPSPPRFSSQHAQYVARPYSHSTDGSSVSDMCKGFFNGRDFLPGLLEYFANDPQSSPIVLELSSSGKQEIVAFSNMRVLDRFENDFMTILVECVRVHAQHRGRKLGRRVVVEGMEFARQVFGESGHFPTRKVHFVAVTLRGNSPMMRIFSSLKFQVGPDILIWPSFQGLSTMKARYIAQDAADSTQSCLVLDILGIEEMSCRKHHHLLDEWKPVFSFSQFESAISGVWKSSNDIISEMRLIPLFFSIESMSRVWKKLTEESGTAWMLPGKNTVIIDLRNGSTYGSTPTVAVLTTDVELAEAAVTFVDRRLCFGYFTAVLSTSLSQELLDKSDIFGLGLDSYVVHQLCA